MSVLGVGQFTIIDFSDIYISKTPPEIPALNQLWLDSRTIPSILNRWNGVNWQAIGPMSLEELDPEKNTQLNNLANDVTRMNSTIITIQNEITEDSILHKVTASDIFQQYTFMQNVNLINLQRMNSVINPLHSYNPVRVNTINENTTVKMDYKGQIQQHFLPENEVVEFIGSSIITNDKLTDRMKSAELKITPGAIVSAVMESTQYKTAIGGIENRMLSAEEKITADAIVDTVTKSTKYTSDIGTIEDRLETAEQKITDNSIISEVVNNLGDRIEVAEEKINPISIINTVTSSNIYRLNTLMPQYIPLQITRKEKALSPLNGYNFIETTLTDIDTFVESPAKMNSIVTMNPDADIEILGDNIVLIQSAVDRIKHAEIKITDDAIVSTVRSSEDYIGDMGSKVGKSEIISMINQSAEQITILANKINLQGEVTLSDLLSPEDKTKIIGSSIYGGTITLGGSGNGNGILKIINSSDQEIVKLNNTGIIVNSGKITINDANGETIMDSTGIRASSIFGGQLTLGGLNNDNGYFVLKDATGTDIVMMDNTGLFVSDGKITIANKDSQTILDGNGINASMITTGAMSFDRARGGTLTLGGEGNVNGVLILQENYFNEETEKFEPRDIVTMDTTGILVDHGRLTVNNKDKTTIIDESGVHADAIYTGYMSFDRAKGGTLSLGGYNNYSGVFSLYNSNWDSEIQDEVDVYELIRMDQTGMYINGGSNFRIGVSDEDYQLYFDGANLHIGYDVSISWNNIDTTGATAEDIGAKDADWMPTCLDIGAMAKATYIDASNVFTGNVYCDHLSAANKNAIIQLFHNGTIQMYDQNGNEAGTTTGWPAIDATYNMNSGVGDAIRLKWDNNNYVLVRNGQIDFYIGGVCVASVNSTGIPVVPVFGD
jgi:hypothetical protein